MNGTFSRRARSASCTASPDACRSLSMTQGPAMRTKGAPPPIGMSPSLTGITQTLYRPGNRQLAGLVGQEPDLPSRDGCCCPGRRVRGFSPIAGFDEAGEQRMRVQRLRLELRMELHGEVPWMIGQFGNLDELAVRRPTRDAQSVLDERPFVSAVEFVAMTM